MRNFRISSAKLWNSTVLLSMVWRDIPYHTSGLKISMNKLEHGIATIIEIWCEHILKNFKLATLPRDPSQQCLIYRTGTFIDYRPSLDLRMGLYRSTYVCSTRNCRANPIVPY